MIFKQAQEVVDGRKRQTRRPVKPGEWAFMDVDDPTKILSVVGANGRLKWQVGKDYAAQPGRGVKAIGRTPPIEAIRRERLLEIKPADCIDEGIVAHLVLFDHEYYREGSEFAFSTPRSAFRHLWNSLYRKPYGWGDNPDVWVVVFEEVAD